MERTARNALEKADLLLMTKHATEKDRSLKSQLFVSRSDSSSNDACSEKIWSKGAFYKDERNDLGMEKVNYPENTLFSVTQGYQAVQKGENSLYVDHFILGQVIPATNIPTDVDTYECGPDETTLEEIQKRSSLIEAMMTQGQKFCILFKGDEF